MAIAKTTSGRRTGANSEAQIQIRTKRREAQRARIFKIVEKQRRARKLISFSEIADWCAREDGKIESVASKRTSAFSQLYVSLLAGEFRSHGRTRVACLTPVSPVFRVTGKFLQRQAQIFDFQHIVEAYLTNCWVPRDFCRQWFHGRRLIWPEHFEPTDNRKACVDQQPVVPRLATLPRVRGQLHVTRATTQRLLDKGKVPGKTVTWKEFYGAVRDEADGWKDPKKLEINRGFSDRNIMRIAYEMKSTCNL